MKGIRKENICGYADQVNTLVGYQLRCSHKCIVPGVVSQKDFCVYALPNEQMQGLRRNVTDSCSRIREAREKWAVNAATIREMEF